MNRHKLFFTFLCRQLGHLFVILAVISQIMSSFGNHLYIVRIGFYPASCHKKGNMYLIFVQNIHNLLGVFIAPGSVKGQRNFFFRGIDTVYRKFFGTF